MLKHYKSSGINVKLNSTNVENVSHGNTGHFNSTQSSTAKSTNAFKELEDWEFLDIVDSEPILQTDQLTDVTTKYIESNFKAIDMSFEIVNSTDTPPLPFTPIDENICELIVSQLRISTRVKYPAYRLGVYFVEGRPPSEIFWVAGDGNCLFSALSLICCGYPSYHDVFCTAICDYIEINDEYLDHVLEGETGLDYVYRRKM